MATLKPHEPILTADEALKRLIDGNLRFQRGEARVPTVRKEILADLAQGQQPYATILGCSDSRVPPELIFDAGFGELFIVRVAGNVLSAEIVGSLQYAGSHLHTPLFVVLGHSGLRVRGGAGGAGDPTAWRPASLAHPIADRQHPARIARPQSPPLAIGAA